jgi:pyruvate dehydrogenase E2 component (dihydrolipoamide acetyltransferase)
LGPKPTSRHIRYSVAIGVKADIEQASPSASSIYGYTPLALNDHRSVDSALGAQLIGAFKALIENPVMMLV